MQNNGSFHVNGVTPGGAGEELTDSGIDLRKGMDKVLNYWYIYVLSFIICISLAWLYLRYATPEYKVQAKILITDDKKGSDMPGKEMFAQLDMFSGKSSVDNEVEILKSRSLMLTV